MWETVFAPCAPGPVSTDADLDRAEAELGFALPESFREFCRTLGAGRANGTFRVATPSPDPERDLVGRAELIAHSISAVLAGRTDHRFDVEGDDPSVIERAFFFGETEAGAFLFWDVVPGRDEYEIWVLGPDLESIRFGGANLVDLMRRSRGPAVRGIFGMDAEPLPASFVGDGTEGASGPH